MSPIPRLKIGVVGATGIVGAEFLKILNDRKIAIEEIRLFASDNSKGTFLPFREEHVAVQALSENCFEHLHVVFFSSGDDISKEWAPKAVRAGAVAVDNSAAFRMDPEVPLVVPEVNSHELPKRPKACLIANPNCSTIQLVVALKPLHDAFGLTGVRVATYQSVSGAGRNGSDELANQTMAYMNHKPLTPQVFPHSIAFNNIPQIGAFDEHGFSSEENKIMKETQKILGLPKLPVSAFTVRTPTMNGHSEAVWVTLDRDCTLAEFVGCLKRAPGIQVIDDTSHNQYPMNATTSGTDPVYVGRIHKDHGFPKTWIFWCVSDNIRKGAALNGVQIFEKMFELDQN